MSRKRKDFIFTYPKRDNFPPDSDFFTVNNWPYVVIGGGKKPGWGNGEWRAIEPDGKTLGRALERSPDIHDSMVFHMDSWEEFMDRFEFFKTYYDHRNKTEIRGNRDEYSEGYVPES